MHSPRITFCITELDVGGAERALLQIAAGLRDRNWDVDVVSIRDKGPLSQPLETAGIPVTALNCGGMFDLRAVFRLFRHLKHRQPQILLSFLHQANLVGRAAALMAGVPTVVSGIRVADRRLLVSIPEWLSHWAVNHYIAVSDSVGKTHREICGIPAPKCSVITNGVDLEAIQGSAAAERSEFGGSSDQFVILFVGRLTEQKAPLDLLQAFAALPPEQRNQCRLVFAGDGPLRDELAIQIDRLGLQLSVHVAGRIARVPEWMKASDVLVLPARWEGLPNVILEAMAAGLPVIAADVDGVREIVTGPEIGRLFPSGDLQALSSLLSEAFCSKGIVGTFPASADHHKLYPVSGKALTWDRCVDEYDLLLRQLIAQDSI